MSDAPIAVKLARNIFLPGTSAFSARAFLSHLRHPLADWAERQDAEIRDMVYALDRDHDLGLWTTRVSDAFGVNPRAVLMTWEGEQNGLSMKGEIDTKWEWGFMDAGKSYGPEWHNATTKTPPHRIVWRGDRRLVLACGAGFAGPESKMFTTQKYLFIWRQFAWTARIIRLHLDTWRQGEHVVKGVRMKDGKFVDVECNCPSSFVILKYTPFYEAVGARSRLYDQWFPSD